MNPAEWFRLVAEAGQSTNAGFVYVSLACVAAVWLLYRGTANRIARLEADLASCNKKHEQVERTMAAQLSKAENLGRSLTALWTVIQLNAGRRLVKLPPLHELLEGRVVLEIRDVEPPAEDSPPPVMRPKSA